MHIADMSNVQPPIYEELAFKLVLDAQAIAEFLPFAPLRAAAFSTACDTEKPALRVQMTEGDLYKERDRMKFIDAIARQYHSFMISQRSYMENTISTIATWRNTV
jgi:hypothetical protein